MGIYFLTILIMSAIVVFLGIMLVVCGVVVILSDL
jgi:hypothetical protein